MRSRITLGRQPSASLGLRLNFNGSPHKMPTTIIATDRLILRSALPQDFEQLFSRVFADARVMQHLSGEPLEWEKS